MRNRRRLAWVDILEPRTLLTTITGDIRENQLGSSVPAAGWTVYVDLDNSGAFEAGEPSAVSAADGTYTINTAVALAFSNIRILPQPNYRISSPSVGYYPLSSAPGDPITGKNFRVTTYGRVTGNLYIDSNGNLLRDASETIGYADKRVYVDINGDGNLQLTAEPSTLTDGFGNYTLDVPLGTGNIKFVPTFDWLPTRPAGQTYTVNSFDEVLSGFDLGVLPPRPTAAISKASLVATEGTQATFSGSGSQAFASITGYQWDFNYNGITFDVDAVGQFPKVTFPDGPASFKIALRTLASTGRVSDIATGDLQVNNSAPILGFSGPFQITRGATYTLQLSRIELGSDTLSAWHIDWGDGSSQVVPGSATSVDHVFTGQAPALITGYATDEDGTWGAGPQGVLPRMDISVGSAGVVDLPVPPAAMLPNALVEVSNGKILSAVAATDTTGTWFITRHLPDGRIDTTFGANGIASIAVLPGSVSYVTSLLVQADGKILVVGAGGTLQRPVLARLLSNGSPDSSFGLNGVANDPVAAATTQYESVAVTPAGKILLLGTASGNPRGWELARLNSNGSADNSFGTQGVKLIAAGAGPIQGRSVLALADGKIILAGTSSFSTYAGFYTGAMSLVRLLTDGQVDISFGVNGWTELTNGPTGAAVDKALVQPDGKIIIVGRTNAVSTDATIIGRYNANGTIDGSFSDDGFDVIVVPNPSTDTAALFNSDAIDVDLYADGRIQVAGLTKTTSGTIVRKYFLRRYLANGTVDLTMGANGTWQFNPTSSTAYNNGYNVRFALLPDGRTVALSLTGGKLVLGMVHTAAGVLVTPTTPSLVVRAPDQVFAGVPFTLELSAVGAVNDWRIDWGDGIVQTLAGSTTSVEHVYASAGQTYTIVVDGSDALGTYRANNITADLKFAANAATTNPKTSTSAPGKLVFSDPQDYYQDLTDMEVHPATGMTYLLANRHFKVMRVKPDGTLDSTWGSAGVAQRYMSSTSHTVSDMSVLPDGSVLVSGGLSSDFWVVKYTSTGQLDSTFGTAGTAKVTLPINSSPADFMIVQPDGKIVLHGNYWKTWVRLNPNGSLDTSFGTGGILTTPPLPIQSLEALPDGSIIASRAQTASSSVSLVRFSSPGVLDTTFGIGGEASITRPYQGVIEQVRALPDGSYIGVGWNFQSSTSLRRHSLAVKFTPTGDPDPSFGTGGAYYESLSSNGDSFEDVQILPDGRLVIVGTASDSKSRLTLVTLTSSGVPDKSAAYSGLQYFSSTSFDEFGRRARLVNGYVMVGGSQTNVVPPMHLTLRRVMVAPEQLSVVAASLAAVPGGPYVGAEGGDIILDGRASSTTAASIVQYEWDLDYDGLTFNADASGALYAYPVLDGPRGRTIALRITDSAGLKAISSTSLDITNVAPTASLTAGPSVTIGSPSTVSFTGASDASPADTVAGFKYSFDFNNDGDFTDIGDVLDSSIASASFTFAANGTFNVRGRIKDKDGGSSQYTTAVVVNPAASSTLTLTALADAYVRDGSYAGTNFGSAANLDVKKDGAGAYRETFLKFDISSLASITSARLRLFGKLSDAVTGGINVTAYDVTNTSWIENALTFATRPAAGASAANANVPGKTAQWIEWDLTAYLQNAKSAGKTQIALVLRAAIGGALISFNSANASANTPQLQVTQGATPPPVQAIVVSTTTAAVNEGASNTFTVKLAAAPTANVTVNIARTGDSDISSSVTSLLFTPADWNTARTVTLTAAEDADTANGSATFTFSAAGLADKTVTATEVDNDLPPSTNVTLSALADAHVRDGASANTNYGLNPLLEVKKDGIGNLRDAYIRFDLSSVGAITDARLRLFGKLSDPVTGGIAVQLFDADSAWSESALTYSTRPATGAAIVSTRIIGTTAQWYEWDVTTCLQQARLDGKTQMTLLLRSLAGGALITFNSRNHASNQPQLAVTGGTPAQAMVVSAAAVSVAEGATGSFTVKLATAPTSDVIVSINRTGDSDLGASVASLIFTPSNWNVAQTITLSAAEDVDTTNGSATFTLSSSGLSDKTVTATEVDNDVPPSTTVSLNALADAHVRDGASQNSNYGASGALEVKKDGPGNYRESYLKFDLSTLSSITSATLRLFGKLSDPVTGGINVSISDVSNSIWAETTLTWATRPATGSAITTFNVSGTTAKWYEIDLTSYLQAQKLAGKTQVTLVLKAQAGGALITFNSRNNPTNPPQLVVT